MQHFLAVYDGWVSPELPVPASAPVMLADAPAQEATIAADEDTTPGFVSWAWGGVRDGAAAMLDALRQWLTP